MRDTGDGGTAVRRAPDGGMSAIELVFVAPVMILFILVLVAFGQMVDARGTLDGAARDAARAGTLQRDARSAREQAQLAAEADTAHICTGTPRVRAVGGGFTPGGLYTVRVTCSVRGLSSLGLPISRTMTAQATSPIDPYRRAQ
jgi:Flp pilus assembly protein TadG